MTWELPNLLPCGRIPAFSRSFDRVVCEEQAVDGRGRLLDALRQRPIPEISKTESLEEFGFTRRLEFDTMDFFGNYLIYYRVENPGEEFFAAYGNYVAALPVVRQLAA